MCVESCGANGLERCCGGNSAGLFASSLNRGEETRRNRCPGLLKLPTSLTPTTADSERTTVLEKARDFTRHITLLKVHQSCL